METINVSWIDYKIIWVWHYTTKAVVLLDMGICAMIKENWRWYECVKVLSALEVPKIWYDVYKVYCDWSNWKMLSTIHENAKWHSKLAWYRQWAIMAIEMMKKKKR